MGHITGFRAYQLGNEGSSFSYCDGVTFTLIEARLTEMNKNSLIQELAFFGKQKIDVLHITSWDNDHCKPTELVDILSTFLPKDIEYPSYSPTTDSGKESLDIIGRYKNILEEKNVSVTLIPMTKPYLIGLPNAVKHGYPNIICHPYKEYESSNDNSLVKFFRSGSFTVLSLGDVELPEIAQSFIENEILCSEVDVMILAHHGADNGFTTNEFLKAINPRLAICSSNYDNKFEHPKQTIKDMLYYNNIPLFTTKTGDVIIKSLDPHKGKFRVSNLISNNQKLSTQQDYTSKITLV